MSSDDTSTNITSEKRSALLLGGGGARAAYQVGVLKALSELIQRDQPNPFPIICGTSAGSINTVALASFADDFHTGVSRIVEVWSNFKLHQVFHVDTWSLCKRILSWAWSNIGFGEWQKGPSSLLDNAPLRDLLNRYVDFARIDDAIQSGDLHAYCLTACSYTSGESTTFYDGHAKVRPWTRTHREGRRGEMNIDHLMASSAIPVIFPSVKLGDEYFGDGSMRQNSPISPALHLGAEKILIIGLRKEGSLGRRRAPNFRPSLGQISGYILDTLFLNSLFADIERMERINRTLMEQELEPGETTGDGLKPIEHIVISPSEDIADIALKHYKTLPRNFRLALSFIGLNRGNSRRFISYLMFVEGFCQELIELGYRDAMAQRERLCEFLGCDTTEK